MAAETMNDLDLGADIIDVRDIIARIEALEDFDDDLRNDELRGLHVLMRDLQGCGGDEQWRGEWYPLTLIRDDYFEQYARELAEEMGAIDRNASWPHTYIDWPAATEALQQDYTSTEIDGETYWYR